MTEYKTVVPSLKEVTVAALGAQVGPPPRVDLASFVRPDEPDLGLGVIQELDKGFRTSDLTGRFSFPVTSERRAHLDKLRWPKELVGKVLANTAHGQASWSLHDGGALQVRMDSLLVPAFWLEVSITAAELKRALTDPHEWIDVGGADTKQAIASRACRGVLGEAATTEQGGALLKPHLGARLHDNKLRVDSIVFHDAWVEVALPQRATPLDEMAHDDDEEEEEESMDESDIEDLEMA